MKLGRYEKTFVIQYAIIPAIPTLEFQIKEFMEFYRDSFPRATVLPKMHLLEDHMVPWMRRWHLGAGFMGEQGAESIHAHLNRLENTYSGIPNGVDRLL